MEGWGNIMARSRDRSKAQTRTDYFSTGHLVVL